MKLRVIDQSRALRMEAMTQHGGELDFSGIDFSAEGAVKNAQSMHSKLRAEYFQSAPQKRPSLFAHKPVEAAAPAQPTARVSGPTKKTP